MRRWLLLVCLITACAPVEEPVETLTGTLTAGHRTVGEGQEISVWSTEESAEIVSSTAIDCPDCVFAFSTELLLTGTYRDYVAVPVEGACCDSDLEERTWESVVQADITLREDQVVLQVTDSSAFGLTLVYESETTTGDVDRTETTEGFDLYPGLLGRSGAVLQVIDGCEASMEGCWTAVDWTDADGAPLEEWPEGVVAGELAVVEVIPEES